MGDAKALRSVPYCGEACLNEHPVSPASWAPEVVSADRLPRAGGGVELSEHQCQQMPVADRRLEGWLFSLAPASKTVLPLQLAQADSISNPDSSSI